MAKNDPTVFISYSHKDSEVADALLRELEMRGLDVWSDSKIMPGTDWRQEIERALKKAQFYLVILTPDSVVSQWNNFEMGVALGRQAESQDVYVIPILLRDVRLPSQLSGVLYLDGRDMDISQLGEKIYEIIAEAKSK
jgi:predicted nucleotide-binding protein